MAAEDHSFEIAPEYIWPEVYQLSAAGRSFRPAGFPSQLLLHHIMGYLLTEHLGRILLEAEVNTAIYPSIRDIVR
jgi:hypothetical protein